MIGENLGPATTGEETLAPSARRKVIYSERTGPMPGKKLKRGGTVKRTNEGELFWPTTCNGSLA